MFIEISNNCHKECIIAMASQHIYVNNILHDFKGGGVDYGSGPYKVTLTAGTTEALLNVLLNDDNIFENNENLMITIDPSSLPNNVTVGYRRRVTVIIMDNDGKYFVLNVCMHELVNLSCILFIK